MLYDLIIFTGGIFTGYILTKCGYMDDLYERFETMKKNHSETKTNNNFPFGISSFKFGKN